MEDHLSQFRTDREQAAKLQDPNANLCAFANNDAAGRPYVRTLVLREVEGKLAVFLNKSSPKWNQNLSNVALCVYLDCLKVQYRLLATTQPIPEELVAQSWQFRPEPPKRMDWFYEEHSQSSVIQSREHLLKKLDESSFHNQPPKTVSGLFLNVDEIERLDLNQANGIHDRRRYRKTNEWQEETLVP